MYYYMLQYCPTFMPFCAGVVGKGMTSSPKKNHCSTVHGTLNLHFQGIVSICLVVFTDHSAQLLQQ